ncbi:hypothetical protein GCM10028778_11110 [Barrientosiimonas marina]|uniref:Uncharacterized protein n=1 Tax=Lentibacillus kimchii TaxID=1542911 RepID=A0ABW2V0U0_9BACI
MTIPLKQHQSKQKQEAEKALTKLADQLHLMEEKITTVSDGRFEKSYQPRFKQHK